MASGNAGFAFQQTLEDQLALSAGAVIGDTLQVYVGFEIDVLADAVDVGRRNVLAEEVLFAATQKTDVCLVDFLRAKGFFFSFSSWKKN